MTLDSEIFVSTMSPIFREHHKTKTEVIAMICQTVKAGTDCAFMTKAGCGYNGGTCHQVVEQCEGCQRVVEVPAGRFCASYPNPGIKWKTGHCNFATHVKAPVTTQQVKINPLKASKRASKAK